MTFDDLGQRPFAIGALFGLRSWEIETSSRREVELCSPLQHYSWSSGVNAAKCNIGGFSHTVGKQRCTCGFYAYYHGRNGEYNYYGGSSRVTGIVQGYGVCSYGTHGFRAAKAEIVAIYNPKLRWDAVLEAGAAPPKRRRRLSRRLSRPTCFVLILLLWTLTLVFGTELVSVTSDWLLFFTIPLQAVVLGLLMNVVLGGKSATTPRFISPLAAAKPADLRRENQELLWNSGLWSADLTDHDFERIYQAYPNVPQYGSLDAMLRAHPVSKYDELP